MQGSLGLRLADLGYLVATPHYRLSPEHHYPAYIEDAARALRWMWDHAAEYGGDRQHMTVSGGSAGGHIAALLTLDERWLERVGLSDDVLLASIPITGLMDATRSERLRRLAIWAGDAELAAAASPVRHARADAPRMLLMVADGDTEERRQENQRMFEAMQKAGHTDVHLEWLENRTHGSILPRMLEDGDPTLERILTFLERLGAAPTR